MLNKKKTKTTQLKKTIYILLFICIYHLISCFYGKNSSKNIYKNKKNPKMREPKTKWKKIFNQ